MQYNISNSPKTFPLLGPHLLCNTTWTSEKEIKQLFCETNGMKLHLEYATHK